MRIVNAIKNLVKGLGIAGKHLGTHAITIQYPEERMEMPERSRGIVVLLSDEEDGHLNCTACELCMRACPCAAIKVEQHRDENKKKVLDAFVVDNTLCSLCGLCEEACNFCAIKLVPKYEFSTTNVDDLIWDVKKLQEMGRDVKYVNTVKIKKAAMAKKKAAAAKAKAEAEAKKATEGGEAPKETAEEAPADKPAPPTEDKPAPEAQPPKPEADKKEGGDS